MLIKRKDDSSLVLPSCPTCGATLDLKLLESFGSRRIISDGTKSYYCNNPMSAPDEVERERRLLPFSWNSQHHPVQKIAQRQVIGQNRNTAAQRFKASCISREPVIWVQLSTSEFRLWYDFSGLQQGQRGNSSIGSLSRVNNIIFPQDVQCRMITESFTSWSSFLRIKSVSSLASCSRNGVDTFLPQMGHAGLTGGITMLRSRQSINYKKQLAY